LLTSELRGEEIMDDPDLFPLFTGLKSSQRDPIPRSRRSPYVPQSWSESAVWCRSSCRYRFV
jgi:hypothetical protein